MSGHTPGNWQVDHSNCVVTVTLPEGIYSIADCDVDSALTEDQQLANAHLIAAAPDMLVALVGVMRDCECVIVDNRSRTAWDAANAAILKAGGKP